MAMSGDVDIRNDGNINQREGAAVEFACQRRSVKLIQPPGGVWIWAAFTRTEQHRYHQWQFFMPCIQVALHGSHRIAYQAESHMLIRGGLVFYEYVNIPVTGGGFQAVEDVTEILAEIILNERAGFQFQRAEIADGPQLCRQMQLHEIPCNIRLRQELPERGIVGSGCAAFFLHLPWL